MRGPSSVVARRQRHNFVNGRITRRPRNRRLLRGGSRALNIPASVYEPYIEAGLQRQSVSDNNIEDRPISSRYYACSAPGAHPAGRRQGLPQRRPDGRQNREALRNQNAERCMRQLAAFLEGEDRNNFTVINVRNRALYELDLRLAVCDYQFTDSFMNYYCQLLVARSDAQQAGYIVAIRAAETRKIVRERAPVPAVAGGARYIVFPIKLVESRLGPWSVVVVDMNRGLIVNYSPITEEYPRPIVLGDYDPVGDFSPYAFAIKRALERFRPNTRGRWNFLDVRDGRCVPDMRRLTGLYVCNYLDCFFDRKTPTLRPRSVDYFLLQVVHDICRNEVPRAVQRVVAVDRLDRDVRQHLERCIPPVPRIIAEQEGVVMYNTDVLTLNGNCVVSQSVVDMYFLLIRERAWVIREEYREMPMTHVIGSVYSPVLVNREIEEMQGVLNRMADFDVIFFPLFVDQSWTLLMINKRLRTIFIYDPKTHEEGTGIPEYVQNMPTDYPLLNDFLIDLTPNRPPQINEFHSGVYICQYARYLSEGGQLHRRTFTDLELPRIRQTMRHELLDRELMGLGLLPAIPMRRPVQGRPRTWAQRVIRDAPEFDREP